MAKAPHWDAIMATGRRCFQRKDAGNRWATQRAKKVYRLCAFAPPCLCVKRVTTECSMNKPWRGIFVILVTPFTETFELDEASLRKQVRFCIKAGAHGLVGPANASEFPTLSDDERKRWIEIVVTEAGGQVPVVATTTAGHTAARAAPRPARLLRILQSARGRRRDPDMYPELHRPGWDADGA